MANIKEINEIIGKYTSGEADVESTNEALKQIGSDLYFDPEKNVIKPGEEDRFGLLDTGTGSLDKVEVKDGRILNCDVGDMRALCHFQGKLYEVHGTELVLKA